MQQRALWSILLALGLSSAGASTTPPSGLATVPTPSASGPVASVTTVPDAVWADLREASRKGDTRALAQGLPRVRGHALEPLVAYWELRSRLDTAPDADILAFMKRWSGSYYEDRLRNDWLLQLARRGDWTRFSQQLPLYRMNDDREVQCYALMQEHQQGGVDVAPRVAQRWLAQRDADEGCAAAAELLIERKAMAPAVAWQRARLGMEANRVRVATQAVGLLDENWVSTVSAIHADPARYLDEKITAVRPRTKELVTLALVRLAALDPQAAAEQMEKTRWRLQLTDEERGWVWGVVGKRLAQRLSDEALAHYAKTDNAHLTDDQLGWKIRAALRAGDWAQVREAVSHLSESEQRQPVWTYWLGRAHQALKTREGDTQATQLFQRIAGTTGFYEMLAMEELGRPIAVPPSPAPLTLAEKDAARRHPGLQRALLAIAVGLRSEGVREWNYSTNLHTPGGMGERELLAAADLACQREVWDRCINTSKRTTGELDYAQRFPMPFQAQVVRRAREIGLDPAYVYGLIRQESRFIMDARSHVGASGLMQVMPATASWTAKRIGLTDFKPHQITDRDTNIAIGTGYLKLVLDDFEGSMPMAAAAYNAGPGRPRAWRNGPVVEAAIWAENIPFDETRDYVKRVLANTTNYAAILSGQPQSLKSRLGVVGPRTATAQAPNRDLP